VRNNSRAQSQPAATADASSNMDAVVQDAESRLAAKKEEQRRINREWNDREKRRQKEEAVRKKAAQVERKRIIEEQQERARAESTGRVKNEHWKGGSSANAHSGMYHEGAGSRGGPGSRVLAAGITPKILRHGGGGMGAAQVGPGRATSAPPPPVNGYRYATYGHTQTTAPYGIPPPPPGNLTGGSVGPPMGQSQSFPLGTVKSAGNVGDQGLGSNAHHTYQNHYVASNDFSQYGNSSPVVSKTVDSAPPLEINSVHFPELGTDLSRTSAPTPSRTKKVDSEVPQNAIDSVSSNVPRPPSLTSSTLPPPGITVKPNSSVAIADDFLNHSEIRATAKEFVPSFGIKQSVLISDTATSKSSTPEPSITTTDATKSRVPAAPDINPLPKPPGLGNIMFEHHNSNILGTSVAPSLVSSTDTNTDETTIPSPPFRSLQNLGGNNEHHLPSESLDLNSVLGGGSGDGAVVTANGTSGPGLGGGSSSSFLQSLRMDETTVPSVVDSIWGSSTGGFGAADTSSGGGTTSGVSVGLPNLFGGAFHGPGGNMNESVGDNGDRSTNAIGSTLENNSLGNWESSFLNDVGRHGNSSMDSIW